MKPPTSELEEAAPTTKDSSAWFDIAWDVFMGILMVVAGIVVGLIVASTIGQFLGLGGC